MCIYIPTGRKIKVEKELLILIPQPRTSDASNDCQEQTPTGHSPETDLFSCYLISTVLSGCIGAARLIYRACLSPQYIQSDGYTCERLGNANGE